MDLWTVPQIFGIMNRDGTGKRQVTKHENFVFRNIIKWIDNDRVLYLDGESTLRIYTISSKQVTTLLNPTNPKPYCVDSCPSLLEYHALSPDKTYFFNLYDGANDNIIDVTNINTFETFTIDNPNNTCIEDVTFINNHIMQFTNHKKGASFDECLEEETGTVIVDLEKKTLIKK
jgi:hypothetical protein